MAEEPINGPTNWTGNGITRKRRIAAPILLLGVLVANICPEGWCSDSTIPSDQVTTPTLLTPIGSASPIVPATSYIAGFLIFGVFLFFMCCGHHVVRCLHFLGSCCSRPRRPLQPIISPNRRTRLRSTGSIGSPECVSSVPGQREWRFLRLGRPPTNPPPDYEHVTKGEELPTYEEARYFVDQFIDVDIKKVASSR
ncbi:unnamed protein product, partial [Mesorhabditis spiculigera]